MNKDYSVTFAPNEDLDGAMCETEESVKGRICRLFGFTSEHLSMQEGFLESAKIAGTRYFAYTSVHFTADAIDPGIEPVEVGLAAGEWVMYQLQKGRE